MDFAALDKKWQKKWDENKVFEPQRNEKKKIFATVPYPYTSGPLHIGHGRTYTIADVWARFKRLQGYNVLWPMAYHISGTPIESISRKLKRGDEKTKELFLDYVGLYESDPKRVEDIVKGFTDPWNVANFFAGVISKDFKSIGFSIDWTRTFTTGDKAYNKFIEWQFESLKSLGLIKKGKHAVQFCPTYNSAVGEDDIKDGDLVDTGIKEFTAIKFPFEDGFLLASTLRPETVYGLTNLWVHPEEEYVKIEMNRENIIVSKQAAQKLEHHGYTIKILETFTGDKLTGKKAQSPVENREVFILPAEFVDMNNATGVVYSVPAHSPDDYINLVSIQEDRPLWQKYNLSSAILQIKPIQVIDVPNYSESPARDVINKLGIKSPKDKDKLKKATKELYKDEFYSGVLTKCGTFAGIAIKDIKNTVKDWLKEQKKALDFFESETKGLQTRDGHEVVVKVITNQWFIDYGNAEWKQKTKKLLDSMTILPEKYRATFDHTISWLHERACARTRGLGTKLPWDTQWVIESLSDSTIYLAYYLISKTIREKNLKPEQLTPGFFDFVMTGKGSSETVSKETRIDKDLLEEMQKDFDYWYPVDDSHTAIAHITNHLTFYLFNHVALFPEKYWPKAITLNELLIREGAKMSKSKGNVIPLKNISTQYGSDLYRLFVASSADLDSIIDWTDKGVEMIRAKLKKFYTLCEDGIKIEREDSGIEVIDQWILSRFNKMWKEAEQLLDTFQMREYTKLVFFQFLNEMTYYLRRAGKPNGLVIHEIINKWCRLLSPFIPHICEEIWEIQGNEGFVSEAMLPKVDEDHINEQIEQMENTVMQAADDIRHVLKIVKKKPKQISIFISPMWKYIVYKEIMRVDPKKALPEIMKIDGMKEHGQQVVKFVARLQKLGQLKEQLDEHTEYDALANAKDFLSQEFGCPVTVLKSHESKSEKAQRAEPGKPGIEVVTE